MFKVLRVQYLGRETMRNIGWLSSEDVLKKIYGEEKIRPDMTPEAGDGYGKRYKKVSNSFILNFRHCMDSIFLFRLENSFM